MKYIILFLMGMCTVQAGFSQKVFSEGVIVYDIYLNGQSQSEGQLTLLVKGNKVKRTILMNTGMQNVVITDGVKGTSITLTRIQNTNYALILTPEELQEKNNMFLGAKYAFQEEQKSLAGYNCFSAEVSYPNGKKAVFYYTRDLKPSFDAIFSMFPGLNGIPLQYTMAQGPNSMNFVAKSLNISNIESAEFDIPKDYKIVTQKELADRR